MKHVLLIGIAATALVFAPLVSGEARWYKGATHVHSLWSDGDGAPEVIADWYKEHGWDFVCFSEHNVLMEGEKFVAIDAPKGHLTEARFQSLQARFGSEWPDVRAVDNERQMRLKTLEELSAHFNEPGEFLLIPAEEMTTQGGNPHMNVINVRRVVPGEPKEGDIAPKMQHYLDTIAAQQAEFGVPMLVHLDHPNWNNPIPTEELLQVDGLHFFEVFNGAGPTDRGDPAVGVPTTERHWDVILSMKLRRDPEYLLYGVATDDSHRYFEFTTANANPGRGWVMVHAESLEADAIVEAMRRGDFYGSCGVTLNAIERGERHLGVDIAVEPGVTYTTRYIGTRKGFDTATRTFKNSAGEPVPGSSLIYSDAIGAVLYETTDPKSRYEFAGDELYVRAVVTSDKVMENPPVKGDLERAWVQPARVK